MADNTQQLTIVIVGDGGVGKSSITLSYVRKEFIDDYDPTIQDSYTVDKVVDGVPWRIEVLDTAGQEEYRGFWGERTVSQGDAFILTYSIDSRMSFNILPSFMHTIRQVKHEDENPSETLSASNTPFPFVVVGNKNDLEDQRQVSATEGEGFANQCGGLFVECSAKEDNNIGDAFESLIRSVAAIRFAEKEHSRNPTMRGIPFNRNIGILQDRLNAKAEGIAFDEKLARPSRRNKELSVDMRRSQSIGGLAATSSRHSPFDDVGNGNCCGSCIIS